MAIYLGTNELSTGGGAGGGGLTETEIFTEDGTWTVPQSVIDEIAAEGHAEVSLFLVGGGAVSTGGNSGEIVSGLRQISGADYDPVKLNVTSAASIGDTTISISAAPKNMVGGVFNDGSETRSITAGASGATSITLDSGLTTSVSTGELRVTHTSQTNPVISVQVGGVAQNSGFTLDPLIPIANNTISVGAADRGTTSYYSFPSDMYLNDDGYPLIQSLTVSVGLTDASPTTSFSGFTVNPSLSSPSSSNWTLTYPSPTAFDGTFIVSGLLFGYSGTYTFKVDGSSAAQRIANRRWSISWAHPTRDLSIGPGIVQQYQSADVYKTEARHGDSGEQASFLNYSRSTDGYFGGFCRINSTKNNSGSPGKTGYVQIVF